MKKIIFAICLCAISFSLLLLLPSEAADSSYLAVEASTANLKQGEEFTVSVKIENNPGVWSVAFAFPIDSSVFEFVSADTDSSIFKKFGECSYDETAAAYKFNGFNSSLFDNVTEDGELVKITLKVKDAATVGSYSVGCELDSKNTVNSDGVEVAIFERSSDVSIAEKKAVSTVTKTQVAIQQGIAVYYYAELDDAHIGAEMQFTMNGKVTRVKGSATGVGNEYVYVLDEVAPQCMGDNIKAELVLSDEVISARESFSIKEYCEKLNKDITEKKIDGYTDETYSALAALICDLLDYGTAAQQYMDYKTAEPINGGEEGGREFVELSEDNSKYIEDSLLDEVKLISGGIRFGSVNNLYFRFLAEGVTEDEFAIRITNYETEERVMYYLSDCEKISESDCEYILYSEAVLPTEFDTWYSVELCTLNSRGRWVAQQLLEYSVSSYVYYMQNQADESGNLTAMANLARALYNYGLSASELASIGG